MVMDMLMLYVAFVMQSQKRYEYQKRYGIIRIIEQLLYMYKEKSKWMAKAFLSKQELLMRKFCKTWMV